MDRPNGRLQGGTGRDGVEVRLAHEFRVSGRTLRQRIPSGVNLGCKWSGAGRKFARFTSEALQEAFQEAWNEATEILAVRGSYGSPLASKSAGSVRARMVGDDAEVEIDIPTGPDGDAILRDLENVGGAVVIRPYLDSDASEGAIETLRAADGGNVMVYQRTRVRSLVVGATDATEGWPAPELVRTPDDLMPEGRAAPAPAPAPVRRRVWL